MMRAVRVSFVAFLCAAAASAGPLALPAPFALSPAGKSLTDKETAALDAGDILTQLEEIPDKDVKKAVAVAIVDAPPEDVFAVLTDYANFTHFMPYCEKVEVRKRKGQRSRVRFALNFPWPLGDRHYVLELTDRVDEVDGVRVWASRWTYVPGSGNIDDAYGAWEVVSCGPERSLVRYTAFTDPGGKLPVWARNSATKVAIPKVIQGLRRRVNEQAEMAAD